MIYHWDQQVQNTQHGLKDWRSRKNWCWNLCPKFGRLGRFNVAAQVQRLSDGRISFYLREAIHLCYDLTKSTLLTKVCLVKAMVFSVVMYRCESWTVKKAECQRIYAFELCCWRRLLRVPWTKEIKPLNPKGNQSWVFIGGTDAEAKAPILWWPDVKTWLIGKDPDARKDWGQEEKRMTEDEIVRWHHRLNGHKFG